MDSMPPDQQPSNAPARSGEEPGRPPEGNSSPNTAEQPSRPYVSNPLQVFLDSLRRLFTVNFATFLALAGLAFLTIAVLAIVIFAPGGFSLIFAPIVVMVVSAGGVFLTIAAEAFAVFAIANDTYDTTGNIGVLILGVIGAAALLVWGAILQATWKKYVIETVRESRISLKKTLGSGIRKAPGLLCVHVLFFGGVLVGLGLFIVPGLLFLYWFLFAPYVYMDTDAGVIGSFRKSKKLTQGKLGELLGLAGTTLILGLPAAITKLSPFYLIAFSPVRSLALAYRYTSADMLQRTNTGKPANHVANVIAALAALIILALAAGYIHDCQLSVECFLRGGHVPG
ncbi:hypothetical protein BRC19_01590 [Candidatus Saccharibacteria bacterium QS_5_54_17]|nr:MAG: hypothetical protein BRC19_01590 [Candidatus Saccharibacteria bacterium QS_5_54_17]